MRPMANNKPKTQTSAFTMRVSEDFKESIDQLQKVITPTPSKADAIRIAVDFYLKHSNRERKGRP